MDLEITKGKEVTKLSDIGVVIRDFRVSSPDMRSVYMDIEGRHGAVNMGATFGMRSIVVPFLYKASDMHDVALLRDELFRLVTDTEPYYVREMRRLKHQSGDDLYVGGKRYKVRLSSSFDIDQTYQYGFGELSFETTDLPYAESIGTTADIDRDGILDTSALWGYGMGLVDEPLKYTHTGTTFRIYNAGNVRVHPFDQYLKITISDVQGSSSFLQLQNTTNRSVFRVNEEVNNDQTVSVIGANVTINSLQSLRKTDRKYIELDPGWNDFILTGATSAKVSFDFRFYYI